MSYVRDLEFKLGREQYTTDTKRVAIEDVIPFNEFLDVEWDESRRTFIFTAHYKQPPTFPCLFNELIGSVFAAHVENKLDGKKPKVISSPWYPRAELNRIKEAENVIYYLLDEDQCELYVGEARFLKKRLGVNRKEIRSWTHFRFDVLPGELEPMRVAIERMVITAIAYMFPNNKQGLVEKRLSDFKLNNKKID